MLGYLRNRRENDERRELRTHRRPRLLPENVFMWGASFWDPWREQASELAQCHLDNHLKELKRHSSCKEIRFFRRGSRLSIDAGTRGITLELTYSGDEILEVSIAVKHPHHK